MEGWNLFMAGLVCGLIIGSGGAMLWVAYRLPKSIISEGTALYSVVESAYEVSQQHELLRVAANMLTEVPVPADDLLKGRHTEAVQQGLHSLFDDMKDLNRLSRKVVHGY